MQDLWKLTHESMVYLQWLGKNRPKLNTDIIPQYQITSL